MAETEGDFVPMKWGNAYVTYMKVSRMLKESTDNLKTAKKVEDRKNCEESIDYAERFLKYWFPDGEPKDRNKDMIEAPYKD